MADSAPGYFGNMNQTLDSPDVHKDSKCGQFGNLAFQFQIRFEGCKGFFTLLVPFFLEENPAGQDYIFPLFLKFHNLELVPLPDMEFWLFAILKINLAYGAKSPDAGEINVKPALVYGGNPPLHGDLIFIGFLERIDSLGATSSNYLTKVDPLAHGCHLQHNLIAFFHGQFSVRVAELPYIRNSFAFSPQVDKDRVLAYFYHQPGNGISGR